MESLPKFILGLAVCFGLPAFAMVLKPYADERNRQPIPYTSAETHPALGDEVDTEFHERPALKGVVYPAATVSTKTRGQQVYARLGCAQCHTQIIRPSFMGTDPYKKGWGSEQGTPGMTETRESTAWDYLGEDFAMIGQRRVGPDLANAGYRYKNAGAFHAMLYAPRATHNWSIHPNFQSLYEVVPVESEPSMEALQFEKAAKVTIPVGKQVIPTADARALAEYVLSLKRDLPLPISLSGKTVAEKRAKAGN